MDVPLGGEWRYELKVDGFRGTFYFDGKKALFRSKTMNRMARFQALADSLARELRGVTDVILDGEIVVADEQRGVNFRALLDASGIPQYAAFDLLWLNGADLREQPYSTRKRRLRAVLRKNPSIALVDSFRDPALFESVVKMDLEGIVAKRTSDPYCDETVWHKVKHRGYTQAEGRAELFHRRK